MSANITFEERVWTIRRQAPVAVGARAEGDHPPIPPASGLWFTSDRQDHRFLAMSTDRLPTEDELKRITIKQFAEWLQQARASTMDGPDAGR